MEGMKEFSKAAGELGFEYNTVDAFWYRWTDEQLKDIVVNVTKSKKLTNMRASGADDKARIVPPVIFSLEEALEYIKEDEYVEVTPHHLRLRKIILDETERKRANR